MRTFRHILFPLVLALALIGFSVAEAAPRVAPQASATSFHFVFSADSRDNYTVLPAFSHKMVSLNPVFGAFGGDLCGSFSTTCINNTWKPAMDGNNSDGMLAKTFVVRGNHDSGTLSTWQGLWDFQSMATRVGATHFSALTSDATYSFDYGNSHFAFVDTPGGSNTWTSSEISWLDSDLTAAESRSVAHEFLFSHGPMYGVTSEHGSEQPSAALKAVLNKHRISAGFHGHEHVTQYTHVTPSVESGINSYQEFTFGRAGAPPYSVVKRTDWHSDTNAFVDVAVNGSQFTVTAYSQSGSAIFSKTFTDGTVTGPTPTPAPSSGTLTFVSTAAYDGHLIESSTTSTLGGSANATATSFRIGVDSSGREYRGLLSFNTAGLPDTAVISSAILKLMLAGSAGTNPFSSMGNITGGIAKGAFSGNIALQAGDFQALPSLGGIITIANNPSGGWYSGALISSAFPDVNRTGTTQLRLRFATVPSNIASARYLSFYSGDSTTATYRPQLVIKYTVP